MPYKDHDRQLAAQKRNYQENRERYLENQRRYRAEGRRNYHRELELERARRQARAALKEGGGNE